MKRTWLSRSSHLVGQNQIYQELNVKLYILYSDRLIIRSAYRMASLSLQSLENSPVGVFERPINKINFKDFYELLTKG